MQQEKETALEAIRNLISYYTCDFQEGNGYTGKQQLVYLTQPQAEVALRYGVPIGIRDSHYVVMRTTPGKPFRYVTISDLQNLERWLAFDSMEPLASIHADLPRRVLESGDSYKAISVMGEYIKFDEAYPSTAVLKTGGLRGDLRV